MCSYSYAHSSQDRQMPVPANYEPARWSCTIHSILAPSPQVFVVECLCYIVNSYRFGQITVRNTSSSSSILFHCASQQNCPLPFHLSGWCSASQVKYFGGLSFMLFVFVRVRVYLSSST